MKIPMLSEAVGLGAAFGTMVVICITKIALLCAGSIRLLVQAPTVRRPPRVPFIVLLPVLNEAHLVNETLSFFRPLLSGRDVLWVVTSPEVDGKACEERAQAWISEKRDDRFGIVRDSTSATKAQKLSRTLELLKARHELEPSDWIAVFDIDSRPNSHVFEAYSSAAFRDIVALQAQPIFEMRRSDSLCAKIVSLAHLRRAALIESGLDRTFLRQFKLRGLWGASLCLRFQGIEAAGGFPPDSDDIEFGYRLDALGLERAYVSCLTFMQPPIRWRDAIRQHGRIFRGVFSAGRVSESVGSQVARIKTSLRSWVTYVTDMEQEITVGFLCVLLILSALGFGWAGLAAIVLVLCEVLLSICVACVARTLHGREVSIPFMVFWGMTGGLAGIIVRIGGLCRFFTEKIAHKQPQPFATPKDL